MTAGPSPSDRQAIDDLYGRYAWAIDTCDLDGLRGLFAPDARIVEPGEDGKLVSDGVDGVAEVTARWLGNPDFRGRQHHVTTKIVDPDPEGRADHWAVRTYFIVTEAATTPPSGLIWCGHSSDIVGKRDEGWRFVVRDVDLWVGDVLAGFDAAPAG